VKFIETDLPGVVIIEPKVFGDDRGFFFESFHAQRFAENGLDLRIAQSNVSRSAHGVLRGLHYQWPRPQGKLVQVLEGEVYDVAVDIRRGSPTFGRWTACVLSAQNKRLFWVPEGFAHGFAVTSDSAVFCYHCTDVYVPEADAGVRWNDAALAIDWPLAEPTLSGKDAVAPLLADIPAERLPVWLPPGESYSI
jgi:dTDP-4-dehydrorhamnose 3,5-epimerase